MTRADNAAGARNKDVTGDRALKFLGYALPAVPSGQILNGPNFNLETDELGASQSFLDYAGVVLFAGSYESVKHNWNRERYLVCSNTPDLDRRERELFSGLNKGKVFVVLISETSRYTGGGRMDDDIDFFRRLARALPFYWNTPRTADAALQSVEPEFNAYVEKFGTGYVSFEVKHGYRDHVKPICAGNNVLYGLVAGNIFLLPCTTPHRAGQAAEAAVAAVDAVLRYRDRMSTALPPWAAEFVFHGEGQARQRATDFRQQLLAAEGEIVSYEKLKGVLSTRSEALVTLVAELFSRFLGMKLTVDDKNIEDASVQDADGKVVTVIEIKGINKNFERAHVNQTDSHRERLGLPAETPAALIINTFMSVGSLQGKDQPPHPDIIKKAAADGVLLIRTLDLLRYADGVERGLLTKEHFRAVLRGKGGWLKVEGDTAQVVSE